VSQDNEALHRAPKNESASRFLLGTMSNKPVGFLSGTDLLHADDKYHGSEVAPSISVSTSERPIKSHSSFICILLISISFQNYSRGGPSEPRPLRSYSPSVLSMDPKCKHEGGEGAGKDPCTC
jgi:hypothetical protein